MKIWLTQRAEPTPHDKGEKRRPMRTGLMAEYLSQKEEQVTWWTGDFDHYGQRQRMHEEKSLAVDQNYNIQYLGTEGYRKTFSFARLRYDRVVAKKFSKLAVVKEKPDVILASMPSIDLAYESVKFGKRHGIPVIVDIRDLHPDIWIQTAPPYLRAAVYIATRPMVAKVRRLCQDATAIWGNSDQFIEWGCRMAGRFRSELDLTIPIAYKPLEVSAIRTQKILDAWRSDGLFETDCLHSVFFGSLSHCFNFEPIFEAARTCNNLKTRHRFHFFGSGVQGDEVTKNCDSLANCYYHGPVGADRLQAAMSVSKIGLAPYIPSENFTQNMPNKPTEYLGGGLIVALGFVGGVLPTFLKQTGGGFCYLDGSELTIELLRLEKEIHGLSEMQKAAQKAFDKHLGFDFISRTIHVGLQQVVDNS